MFFGRTIPVELYRIALHPASGASILCNSLIIRQQSSTQTRRFFQIKSVAICSIFLRLSNLGFTVDSIDRIMPTRIYVQKDDKYDHNRKVHGVQVSQQFTRRKCHCDCESLHSRRSFTRVPNVKRRFEKRSIYKTDDHSRGQLKIKWDVANATEIEMAQLRLYCPKKKKKN